MNLKALKINFVFSSNSRFMVLQKIFRDDKLDITRDETQTRDETMKRFFVAEQDQDIENGWTVSLPESPEETMEWNGFWRDAECQLNDGFNIRLDKMAEVDENCQLISDVYFR